MKTTALFLTLLSVSLSTACAGMTVKASAPVTEAKVERAEKTETVKVSAAPATERIAVILFVDDSRPLRDVVSDLERRGFTRDNSDLEALHMLSGSVDATVRESLTEIHGVTGYERSQPFTTDMLPHA